MPERVGGWRATQGAMLRRADPRWEWLQALGAGVAPSMSTWRSLRAMGGQSLPPVHPAPWLSCDGVMVQGHSLLAWGEVMCPRSRGHCPQSRDGAAGSRLPAQRRARRARGTPHPSCLGYFGLCVPCQLSAGIADRELSDGK